MKRIREGDVAVEEQPVSVKPKKKKKKVWIIIGIVVAVLVLAVVAFMLFGQRLLLGSPGGGDPWIDSDLKENISADMTLDPAEDFHLYVNYNWLKDAEIEEGHMSTSPFDDVQNDTDKKALAIFDDPTVTGRDADMIRVVYNAWLDWDTRNALGVEPIRTTVEDIESISTLDEMTAFICDYERSGYGVPTFANLGNFTDLNDATKYIIDLDPDSLILYDSAEYENKTQIGAIYENIYSTISSSLLQRLGYSKSEAAQLFKDALAADSILAKGIMTSEEQMADDVFERSNNVFTPAEFFAMTKNFPLEPFAEAMGYGNAERFRIPQVDYCAQLDELYTEENLGLMKANMIVKYVVGMSTSLDQEAYDLYIDVINKANGSEGRLTDEEYAYDMVGSLLSEQLQRCYLERYDATETKERVEEICHEAVDYYRQMLQDVDWLSEQTRREAINKLDQMDINVAYPESWNDDSALSLSEGMTLIDCIRAVQKYNHELDWTRTDQTVDPELWGMSTLECNAFYNAQNNSINILLGILGGEFYSDDMTKEQICGGIGSVIGHEISHAFDTSGAQFDADGSLKNWWTDADYDAFTARADKLAAYYDGITAFGSNTVSGQNVKTEAIADMAGLKCMLAIAESDPDFDYDLFFRQYAMIWREQVLQMMEYMALTQDTHPINYLRTNVTLQQFDRFYDVYGIKEGDTMYLAPDARIAVW